MTLFETPLYRFELVRDRKILKFTWTDQTQAMSFLNFQESCMIYAGLALEYDTRLLLVDTREFRFDLPEDYLDWKNQHLNPRYSKVPVTKQAFLMPENGIGDALDQEYEESGYLNRFFAEEQEAINWLSN